MMTLTDDQLIAAWHSDKPLQEIAADLNLPPKSVVAHWRRLRKEDKLPPGSRPLHSQHYQKTHEHVDGRPRVDPDYDPLLEALVASGRKSY